MCCLAPLYQKHRILGVFYYNNPRFVHITPLIQLKIHCILIADFLQVN